MKSKGVINNQRGKSTKDERHQHDNCKLRKKGFRHQVENPTN